MTDEDTRADHDTCAQQDDIVYRVNDADEIVYVNDAWDRFSAANDGETASAAHVLHRPLWDFITDVTTCELYRQVLRRIRSGRSVQYSFRCDSPDCRRLLEMRVRRAADGTIEFRTRQVSTETREPLPILDSTVPRSEKLLRVCSWCCKIMAGESWVEAEEAVDRLRLFEHTRLPFMTHGICPDCYQRISKTLTADQH